MADQKYEQSPERLLDFLFMLFGWRTQTEISDIARKKLAIMFKDGDDVLEDITPFLEINRFDPTVFRMILRKLKKFPESDDTVMKLIKRLTKELRSNKNYKHLLDAKQKGAIAKLISYFNAKPNTPPETIRERIDDVLRFSKYIENRDIRRIIRTIPSPVVAPLETFKSLEQEEHALAEELFGTTNPTLQQMKAAKKKDPAAYKEYSKRGSEATVAYKDQIVTVFQENGWRLIPLATLVQELKKQGLPNRFQRAMGFKGQVDQDLLCFTSADNGSKELDQAFLSASDIRMNQNWSDELEDELAYKTAARFVHAEDDEGDDDAPKASAYYCTFKPPNAQTKKRGRAYTLDFLKRTGRKKFTRIKQLATIAGDIKTRTAQDMKSKTAETRAKALVIAILNSNAPLRMGSYANATRKDPPNYGITTLQARHVKFKDNVVIFEFMGKDDQPNKYQVNDPTIVVALQEFKADKKPRDWFWSLPKERGGHGVNKRLVSSKLMRAYLEKVAFKGAHIKDFRNYCATRLVDAYLNGGVVNGEEITPNPPWNNRQKSPTLDEAVDYWMKVMGRAAKLLSHKEGKISNILNNYCDPEISRAWFRGLGFEPPTILQQVTASVKSNDIADRILAAHKSLYAQQYETFDYPTIQDERLRLFYQTEDPFNEEGE